MKLKLIYNYIYNIYLKYFIKFYKHHYDNEIISIKIPWTAVTKLKEQLTLPKRIESLIQAHLFIYRKIYKMNFFTNVMIFIVTEYKINNLSTHEEYTPVVDARIKSYKDFKNIEGLALKTAEFIPSFLEKYENEHEGYSNENIVKRTLRIQFF